MYQRWMYIGMLGGSLAFAFIGGPLGSVYLSIIAHWPGNNLMLLIITLPVFLGGG